MLRTSAIPGNGERKKESNMDPRREKIAILKVWQDRTDQDKERKAPSTNPCQERTPR
jgi:hypothetical protein